MNDVCDACIDLLVQNANNVCYPDLKDWFGDCAVMYALTVASGNDTYLKSIKYVFDKHISKDCENNSLCEEISRLLSDMITLLTA